MLNVVLQCCGLMMLVIIFSIFISERSLDLYSRRLYFYALISCMLCVSLDILSIVGIALADTNQIPRWVALVICKLYVASLVFQSYEGFLYAAGEFFTVNSHIRLKQLYSASCLVGIILVFAMPIDFYMKGRVVYSFGLSTTITYIFTIVYIVSTIFMAFRGVDRASSRRRRAILLWQFSWLAAACLQLLNPELLLVGFAAAFGMVILYAELENPQEGIDRMTGQYTANALLDYVNDRYHHHRTFSSIYVYLEQGNLHSDLEVEKTILVRAANFLKLSEKAYVFRNAGTEFALIFPDSASMQTAYERIRKGLRDAIDIPIRIHYILTPDSSIANHSDEFFSMHQYLSTRLEDKNCITADITALERIREYEKIKEMIQSALDEQRVEVFYHPIYNVKEKRFTSAEALVRIRDTNGNIVPPGVFIPIAETNGLIVPLGEEIFRQVCELLASKNPTEYGISYIEVNLSVAQFDQENLAKEFTRIVDAYGIDFSLINLEITETASSSAKQTLLKNMNKMMGHGAHFSLDDFGTGRSNLDYFVEMPVNIIKFDFTFTQAYFTNEKARYVMESVIGMMRRMGLSIVSEGVETKAQFDAMCELGVDYIQGFYFSKPLPKEEFLAFLKKHNDTGNQI